MPFWPVALVLASALHAGFQLTVTAVAYPVLAGAAEDDFARAHTAHSRGIVPLVALVYAAVLVAALGGVVDAPGSFLAWSAALASAAALLMTALRAAPLHGRLGRLGPDPALVRSLLRADRLRSLLALLALTAATIHALVA